jgi:hypothetical protein
MLESVAFQTAFKDLLMLLRRCAPMLTGQRTSFRELLRIPTVSMVPLVLVVPLPYR